MVQLEDVAVVLNNRKVSKINTNLFYSMGSKREDRASVCDRWNLEYVVCFVTRLWRVPPNIWVFTTIFVIISHGNKYD